MAKDPAPDAGTGRNRAFGGPIDFAGKGIGSKRTVPRKQAQVTMPPPKKNLATLLSSLLFSWKSSNTRRMENRMMKALPQKAIIRARSDSMLWKATPMSGERGWTRETLEPKHGVKTSQKPVHITLAKKILPTRCRRWAAYATLARHDPKTAVKSARERAVFTKRLRSVH